MPNPKGPAFTYGIAFHEAAEQYLLTGRMPDDTDPVHATMLRDGAVHLPLAGTVPVESLYSGILAPGLMYQCRLDFEYNPDGVGDHKTTSGEKWAMTEDELFNDVQAIMCAHAKYDRGADLVTARWVYYNKKRKHHTWPVRVTLPREHVQHQMETVVIPAAEEILALRGAPKCGMNEVTSDPDSCDHVGKFCNFVGQCRMYE